MAGTKKTVGISTTQRLYQSWGLLVIDAFCIALALFAAYMLRFEFGASDEYAEYREQFFKFLPFVILIRLLIYALFRLYKGVQFYASVGEAMSIAVGTIIGSALFAGANALIDAAVPREILLPAPRSVVVLESILAFLLVGSNRFWPRLYVILTAGRKGREKRLIVIGANHGGVGAARSLIANPTSNYKPVAFVDPDPALKGRRIDGIPVLGGFGDLGRAIEETDANEILIALPDASPRDLRAIVRECEKARVHFRRLPGVGDVMSGRVTVNDLPPVEVEDLLGRPTVELTLDEEKNYLRGERVLITGAGGSIGGELCRQISSYGPECLILLGRGENSIYEIANEQARQRPEQQMSLVIGDVRDESKMAYTFEVERPTVVFHAAAHKHVPLMQLHPEEAIKNNVFGSLNLARLADRHGVKHFIQISTDKAVRPTNVMGASKRVAEMAIQQIARDSETAFYVVRFGNVLGSRGSVIPLLKKQIQQGGPVTVTHPDVTRYFMTIPEAVSLVLQTVALGSTGQLFVLDMGQPVKIVDLARNIITLSGYEPDVDIDIEFIGLRPGEKLTEELLTKGEGVRKTDVGKVFVVDMKEIDATWLAEQLAALEDAAHRSDRAAIDRLLRESVPDYQPFNGSTDS